MTARIIDGKAIAAELRGRVADAVASAGARPQPGAGARGRAGRQQSGERGLCRQQDQDGGRAAACARSITACPRRVSEADLLALVGRLNSDPVVHGILVQLPLPAHIDAQKVVAAIDPRKDVDGFHPDQCRQAAPPGLPALVPCTPLGCVMLAKTVQPSLEGLEAVVIGRSNIVGKPLAQLLLAENATVTIAHSKTRDLPDVCRRADLLFAAVGRPEMVRGDWIKPGATVIDVGINRVAGRGRQVAPRRRRGLRGGARGRGRDHAGAGRRRADDDRLPAGQHGARGLRAGGPAAADLRAAEVWTISPDDRVRPDSSSASAEKSAPSPLSITAANAATPICSGDVRQPFQA